jgi:hypothetical protein
MTSGPPSVLEIACDESGYEGDKLIETTTDLFAHASVALDVESAADCIRELRSRIRSPAEEYKANHILRQKHRDVLTWFLGSASPVQGWAQVYLVDKVYSSCVRSPPSSWRVTGRRPFPTSCIAGTAKPGRTGHGTHSWSRPAICSAPETDRTVCPLWTYSTTP